jgi:hypothetical protein
MLWVSTEMYSYAGNAVKRIVIVNYLFNQCLVESKGICIL